MKKRTSYNQWQRFRDSDNYAAASDWRDYGGQGAASLLKSKPTIRFEPVPSDVIVQCPKCKTVETLQFVGQTMLRSRKFSQRDGQVYHDCGSEQPCRLRR